MGGSWNLSGCVDLWDSFLRWGATALRKSTIEAIPSWNFERGNWNPVGKFSQK